MFDVGLMFVFGLFGLCVAEVQFPGVSHGYRCDTGSNGRVRVKAGTNDL